MAGRKRAGTAKREPSYADNMSRADELTERVRGRIDALLTETSDRGREAVETLESAVTARPLLSVLASFGLGLMVGRLLDRR
jgi:ElaB/YqjD/DUF883 family membrane-anchored ribosome-binding protein